MRVVYWARLGLAKEALIAGLGAEPGVELTVVEGLPELLRALPGADGLVLYDAPASQARQVVEQLDQPDASVRWMHFVSAGREGFEAAGLPARTSISGSDGAVAPAVAEHAMALLLALKRRVPDMVRQTAEGRWDRGFTNRAASLEGETVAIVGFGHIGRQLARRLRPFGAHVVVVNRTTQFDDPALAQSCDELLPLSELKRVLARADAVVLTLAQSAETRHLIGRDALAACKRGAILVNVARGGIIDQAALREALESGQLGAAGLDVTDPEPLPDADPLWRAPNLLVSPHFAGGGSKASVARLVASAVQSCRRSAA
ncbi:MAG TPA: D-2-hydroxyacid dehydrogenase [Burkholderiaceae bacterium]|jgi:phosphoglycerate dehydrogenase-like enzyme